MVKTALDQAFFSPAILAIFMGGISVLEGRSMDEIKQKFQNSYSNGLINSYCYWPFVNMFTFAIIPVHYRPIVNSCFGIGWNSYLSHMNQKSGKALHFTTAASSSPYTSSLAATNLSS
jgi:protein Mpv17